MFLLVRTIDNNTEAFLTILRAGLWEQEVRLSSLFPMDFSAIYEMAEEQSVVGLLAAGLEQVADVKVPQDVVLEIVGSALQLEQCNREMNAFIAELVEKMRKNGIYTLLVKGQGIAQCYEKPLWRASGDIDLFLIGDDYKKAQSFLIPIAESVQKESGKHHGMTIGPWIVELHGNLHCGLSARMDRSIDEVQRDVFYGGNVRSWMNGNTQVFLPSADNDIIFIFTHFLKHFYKGGLGLRQICDWCRLLWTYRNEVNVGLLEERLRAMGLMTEWKAFGAFAVDILGMPCDALPLYDGSIHWKRKAQHILSFILMSGNMGHNRDRSYRNYPFVIRKVYSMGRRVGDMVNHARIFPLDSLRFLPRIFLNGVRSAAKGIG